MMVTFLKKGYFFEKSSQKTFLAWVCAFGEDSIKNYIKSVFLKILLALFEKSASKTFLAWVCAFGGEIKQIWIYKNKNGTCLTSAELRLKKRCKVIKSPQKTTESWRHPPQA